EYLLRQVFRKIACAQHSQRQAVNRALMRANERCERRSVAQARLREVLIQQIGGFVIQAQLLHQQIDRGLAASRQVQMALQLRQVADVEGTYDIDDRKLARLARNQCKALGNVVLDEHVH